jgi:CHASE1-domain containing sensor protein
MQKFYLSAGLLMNLILTLSLPGFAQDKNPKISELIEVVFEKTADEKTNLFRGKIKKFPPFHIFSLSPCLHIFRRIK